MDNFYLRLLCFSASLLMFFPIIEAKGQSTHIREDAPRVYIDCEDCDLNHIRSEINFVNFVTETRESDIHVLIVTQTTGSGGQLFTLYFIGRNIFSGKSDTLQFNASPDDTYSIIRQKLTNFIKIGLVPFIKNSPIANYLSIKFTPPANDTPLKMDKW